MNLFYLFLLTLLNVMVATSMPAGSSQDEERNVDKDPVHGEWSSWERWAECTQPCGGGVQRRERFCTNPSPQHEGKYCPGDQFDRRNCNTDECDMKENVLSSNLAVMGTTTWGSWTGFSHCSGYGKVDGFRLRVEESGNSDETSLNSIELTCSSGGKVNPHLGFQGEWSGPYKCGGGNYMTGARLRSLIKQGFLADDVAATNLEMQCNDGNKSQGEEGLNDPAKRGVWGAWASCSEGDYICGLRVRMESESSCSADCTALNQVQFSCCKEGQLSPSSSSPLEDMAIHTTTNTATTTTTKEPMLSLEEAIARFTQKFYLQMSRDPDNTGKNFVLSPLSLHTALTLLYEGTTDRSTSQKELEDSVSTHDGLKNEYKELERFYENVETFKMANKMWMTEGFSLNDEYENVTKDYFGAEIENINFTNETAVENVNKWISEMTDNKIEELVEQFSPDTKLFLANVLHFKDSWKVAFKKTANDQMFTLTTEEGEKEEISIPMMEHESSDNYQFGKIISESGKEAQFVKIPYNNENFEMQIIMGDSDLDTILEEVNLFSNSKKEVSESIEGIPIDSINVVMPKFKIDSNMDAGKILKEMGVKAVFEKSELGKMTSEAGIVVSDVAHRAVVEVDEEGTEAAAATAVVAVALSAPGERINFNVNKPFVFIIQDAINKIPILVGRVQDPRL